MLNPIVAADIANTLKTAINGISLILLIVLVPGIIGTLVMAISHLFENQED